MPTKPISFNLNVSVTVDELAENLTVADVNHLDLVELIKKIDEKVGAWDFTLILADHFEKLRLEYFEEFPDSDDRDKTQLVVVGLIDDESDTDD